MIGLIGMWLVFPLLTKAQNVVNVPLTESRFITGDALAFKAADYDDTQWKTLKMGTVWQQQGYPDYHGYAWYRIHVILPASLKEKSSWKDSVRIYLAHVNDVDETFLNGKRIGHTGSFPDEPGGYQSKWPAVREYHLPVNDSAIKWNADNVIAVRVYDGGGSGGIFMGQPYVDMLEKINGISIQMDNNAIQYISAESAKVAVSVSNKYNITVHGLLYYEILDKMTGKTIEKKTLPVTLLPLQPKIFSIKMPNRQGIAIKISFTEAVSGLAEIYNSILPYILTPVAGDIPRINGAAVTGVQPGHPLIYKIPATGKAPLSYVVENMPGGLQLNAITGVITGTINQAGDYALHITVNNNLGAAHKLVTVKVGKMLALTPPMGWNSWNCWGLSVSDEKVKSSAQALVDKGLINHGWTYINIDDGWEASGRAADGKIIPNKKFPEMKGLGDFLHINGLKFGIYSSPGTHTCGGFLGSYQHELLDAATYAEWGIDYLKYDLCSYLDSMKNKTSLTEHQLPYQIMSEALGRQNRDIVYSICQYGMQDVWKWGNLVNGNLWRTTEDIEDTWESLYNIGFRQDTLYSYAKPGRWNDPDMLTVGMVGWGENLHPSRLTPDEQYAHISLWSLLSAPLLIGCDINGIDRFTLNLLTNDEVIAIDQDSLGRQAKRMLNQDSVQVWVKDLADGGKAVGIFNIGSTYKKYELNFKSIGLNTVYEVRDVWRQKNIGKGVGSLGKMIPPHGVFLCKIVSYPF
jgi:hypothetical protein